MANKEEISWLRSIGYALVACILIGAMAGAVALGTVLGIPILIIFLMYEYHRDKSEPNDQ